MGVHGVDGVRCDRSGDAVLGQEVGTRGWLGGWMYLVSLVFVLLVSRMLLMRRNVRCC